MENKPKDMVFKWYYRSRLDYYDQFINLFISYNAWYKKATNEGSDRAAINALKQRSGIWEEYLEGKTMTGLTPYFEEIVRLTNQEPLQNQTRTSSRDWDGIVRDITDWENLIEYWYRIRCNIFHGSKSPSPGRDNELVRLAYESLDVFMTEIVTRMENNFSNTDLDRIFELSMVKMPDSNEKNSFTKEAQANYYASAQEEIEHLHNKFRNAKNLWEVDLKELDEGT